MSQQQLVPVDGETHGLTIPAKQLPDLTGAPSDVLAGATPAPGLDSADANGYVLPNGAHVLQVFDGPVNYQNDTGDWVPIKPALVSDGEGSLQNKAAPFTLAFPELWTDADPVEVDTSDGTFAFSVSGAQPAAVSKDDKDTITYTGVLPGVDVRFDSNTSGYRESFVYASASAAANPVVLSVQTQGVSLEAQPTGEINVIGTSGEVVGVIPAPSAVDASVSPVTGLGAEGSASYALASQGGGDYTMTLTVDQAYAAGATYPLTVDPPTVTVNAQRDASVSVSHASTSYESDPELYAGNATASDVRKAWLKFNTGDYKAADRITEQATVSVWPVFVNTSSVDVNLVEGTSSWPAGSMTWNNQPSAGATVYDTDHGATGNWYQFDVTDLYQKILDSSTGYTNNGMRLTGDPNASPQTSNYHRFASLETTIGNAKPQLFVQYDDQPGAPSLSSPVGGDTITYDSPTLKVTGKVTDPQGQDAAHIRYQVSLQSDFSNTVTDSGWIPNGQSWTVPSGTLLDGRSYYWRAQSWDGWPLKGHSYPASNTRQFTVSLPHLGADSRWPMWKDSAGNGIDIQVNESNGNLFLSYPVETLQTPVGPLSIAMTWNSQDGVNSGYGRGWVLSAGAGSDPRDLPVELDTIDSGEARQIRFRDGDKETFTKISDTGNISYFNGSGAGAGTLQHNTNGGASNQYIFQTPAGGRFIFDNDGALKTANPATTNAGQPGLSYTYDASGHLTQVDEPLGHTVTVSDDPVAHVKTIAVSSIDSEPATEWHVAYDASDDRVLSITDPLEHTVDFSYQQKADDRYYVTGVTDARSNTWTLGYQAPDPDSTQTKWLVSSVQNPGAYRTSGGGSATIPATTFSYAGPYTGTIDTTTTITDPRGNVTGTPDPNYQTIVQMDTGGFPIKLFGPPEQIGSTPVRPETTTLWDRRGNMLCERSPAANAVREGCVAGNQSPDTFNTEYAYQSKAPYQLESKTAPAPYMGTGGQMDWTYDYDEDLTGLLRDGYSNDSLSGIANNRSVNENSPATQDWGTGAPTGVTVTNGWSVRWTGILHVDTQGTYRFKLFHDDGARFMIGNQILEDCWDRNPTNQNYMDHYNCGSDTADSVELWPGTQAVTIQYHDISGAAGINLQWDAGDADGFVTMSGSNFDPGLDLLTSSVDPLGLTTTYAYSATNEARGIPDSVTRTPSGEETGRTTTYTYDDFGRVLHDHNAAGTVANTYNADMPCLDHTVDRAGTETDYTCNSAGDILTTSVVVPAVSGTKQDAAQTRTTTTTYNELGQVTSVTAPGQSQATVSAYYPNNLLEDTTDPLGRVTSFDYNPAGWMTQKTMPVDQAPNQPLVQTYAYDAAGNQTVETKSVGSTSFSWTTAYDAQSRVTSTTVPGVSNPTTYEYDQVVGYLSSDAGFLSSSVTDPAGVKTTTGLDLLGRTKDVKVGTQTGGGPDPTVTHYTSQGTLDTVTDPTGVVTQYTFDDYGEQLSSSMVTDPDGTTFRATSQTYDDAGRVATTTDQRGYVTTFGYDGDGRVTSVQPSGVAQANEWKFIFDAAGDRVQTIDPAGRTRDWAYDAMGRVVNAYEYPQTGTTLQTSYHYDADSQLVSVDDPRGFVLCYTYDGLGNRLNRYKTASDCSGSQSDVETWSYSPLSGMTGAVESGGASVSIGYDAANPERLATVTEGSASTTYAYSAANGRLSSVTDPAGQTSYGYDSATGRVSTITDPFTGLAKTAYTYDDAGRVLTRTDTAGLTLTNTYDAAGRLSSAVTRTPGSVVVSSYAYSYDSASNVTGYTQTLPTVSGQANPDSGSWAYTYNQREELETATLGSSPTLTYGYDDSGDRTSVQVGTGTPTSTTYDGADRVLAVGSTSYTWDAADQLTAVGSDRSYSYDAWGRTTSATVGATSVSYAYDALDRTMSRTPSSGSATAYAYIGLDQSIASATTGTDAPILLAYRQESPMAQQQGTTIRTYEQNPHGDLSVITDTTGTPTGTISYDPWGTVDAAIGTDAQQSLLGYQSQPTDPTTGLTDMGTRLYDPTMGRFTERDVIFGTPTNPLTLNQYAYANDSPLVYTDPTGNYADPSGCTTAKCYNDIMKGSASGIVSSQGGDPSSCAVCQTGNTSPTLKPLPAPAAPTVQLKPPLPPGWFKPRTPPIGARGWRAGSYCFIAGRGGASCFDQPDIPAGDALTGLTAAIGGMACPGGPPQCGAFQHGTVSLVACVGSCAALAISNGHLYVGGGLGSPGLALSVSPVASIRDHRSSLSASSCDGVCVGATQPNHPAFGKVPFVPTVGIGFRGPSADDISWNKEF